MIEHRSISHHLIGSVVTERERIIGLGTLVFDDRNVWEVTHNKQVSL
jgi:hypothetical protein